MRKTWFRKLNHSVLKRKTPLLGFTVLQLFILFVVINSGIATIVLSQRQQPTTQDTGANIPIYEAATPAATPITETSNTPNQQDTTNTTPKDNAVSAADRCLKLHADLLGQDINDFRRDIEFTRKNLATVDINADLSTEEENNKLRNMYIKYYNDARSGAINVYKRTMTNNGCSSYIKEPHPGYVDYY